MAPNRNGDDYDGHFDRGPVHVCDDVRKNLEEPLKQIHEEVKNESGEDIEQIRVGVRTGDTKPSERASMKKHHPHILNQVPER
mgnify:CR=1 FL=1